jgi:hypothetical protein
LLLSQKNFAAAIHQHGSSVSRRLATGGRGFGVKLALPVRRKQNHAGLLPNTLAA